MQTYPLSSSYSVRANRSYRLENTSVTHKVSKKISASLFLATHSPENKSPATDALFEVLITVEGDDVANLRHVASEACGQKIDSFEIQPTKKPTQRLIRLRCFGKATIAQLMGAVVSKLECAEFGRVYPV